VVAAAQYDDRSTSQGQNCADDANGARIHSMYPFWFPYRHSTCFLLAGTGRESGA
jgi:hypothetical protein